MTPEEEAAWKEYLYGPMSDEEIANLHRFAESALQATAQAANDGDHRCDDLAPSFVRITIDTEAIQQQRNGAG